MSLRRLSVRCIPVLDLVVQSAPARLILLVTVTPDGRVQAGLLHTSTRYHKYATHVLTNCCYTPNTSKINSLKRTVAVHKQPKLDLTRSEGSSNLYFQASKSLLLTFYAPNSIRAVQPRCSVTPTGEPVYNDHSLRLDGTIQFVCIQSVCLAAQIPSETSSAQFMSGPAWTSVHKIQSILEFRSFRTGRSESKLDSVCKLTEHASHCSIVAARYTCIWDRIVSIAHTRFNKRTK